jgi:hypothetical protein
MGHRRARQTSCRRAMPPRAFLSFGEFDGARK